MCDYCNFTDPDGTYTYGGKVMENESCIDGANQNIEVNVQDNPELESKVLHIDGVHTDIDIIITHCPKCGRKL